MEIELPGIDGKDQAVEKGDRRAGSESDKDTWMEKDSMWLMQEEKAGAVGERGIQGDTIKGTG